MHTVVDGGDGDGGGGDDDEEEEDLQRMTILMCLLWMQVLGDS